MSAKPSEAKPTDPVDTVTDKLINLETDSAAAKKAEKKARQKAKKEDCGLCSAIFKKK